MRRLAARVALVLATAALQPSAQTASTIAGRIVDDGGDPVRNVRVTIAGASIGVPVVLSDGDGRFALPAAPGRGTIVLTKAGFGRTEKTIEAPAGTVEIRLPRGAVIAGRVLDELGDAVVGTIVMAEVARPGSSPSRAAATTRPRSIGHRPRTTTGRIPNS